MDKYLVDTKAALCKLDDNKVHVVLGNEACDLDSVVSALVYAFYVHSANIYPGAVVIPVLNVRREFLKLRKEVTYYIQEHHISLDSLICKEELDLQSLIKGGQLTVTLVDHNQLARDDTFIKDFVIEIVDHHQLQPEWETRKRCRVNHDMTGSCSTLIAENILSGSAQLVDRQIASLLYGTIIFDTICLNDAAKRVTPRDKEVAKKLKAYLDDVDPKELFNKLRDVKHNISDFAMEELLHSDLKIICNDTIKIAVASIPSLLQDVVKNPAAEGDLSKFSASTKSQIVILMGISIDAVSQVVTRELAIYSPTQGYKEQMVDLLESASTRGPKLMLQSLISPFVSLVLYRQLNSAASRKVIIPLLNTFLFGGASLALSLSGDSQEKDPSRSREPEHSGRSSLTMARSSADDYDLDGFDPLRAEGEDTLLDIAHLQVLGAGDPISHAGSSQSSSNQNSCPYTPQNSCMDGGLEQDPYARQILPSFNSREMMEKIESKRGKLRGGFDTEADGGVGGTAIVGDVGASGGGSRDVPPASPFSYSSASYPFTPKNSFVESSFDGYYVRGGAGAGAGCSTGAVGQSAASLDSSDLLFRVNEKVTASLGATLVEEEADLAGGGTALSIVVPPSVTSSASDAAEPRLFLNGHRSSSTAKCNTENVDEAAIENGDGGCDVQREGGSVGDGVTDASAQHGVQSCPEAASLSDKIDKSDEKMDTSETSGSSEKTSPIPNDVELQTSSTNNTCTTDTTTSINATNTTTTTAVTPSHTNAIADANTTGAITNANHVKQQSAETDPVLLNARTESTTSISSYQGEEADLELAANYQTETVDFPDNPLQLKLMNQTVLLQESSADDDTEQPDDEVFRAVLSPSSDGVKLRKVGLSSELFKTSIEDLRGDEEPSGDCDCLEQLGVSVSAIKAVRSDELSTASGANNSNVTVDLRSDGIDASCLSENTPDCDLSPDYYRLNAGLQGQMISTPYLVEDGDRHQLRNFNVAMTGDGDQSGVCRMPQSSTLASLDPATYAIVDKMHSCLDTARVKDVYTLCGRLQDKLTVSEIECILQNSTYFSEYFEPSERQYVLEAVRALRYDHDLGLPVLAENNASGGSKLFAAVETKNFTTPRTKIHLNQTTLDDSITERFERELEISAMFEGNRSLRRSAKPSNRSVLPSFSSYQGTFDDSRPSLLGICHGDTEAFFEESVTGDSAVKLRKIAVPDGLMDMSVSTDLDSSRELDASECEQSAANLPGRLDATCSTDRGDRSALSSDVLLRQRPVASMIIDSPIRSSLERSEESVDVQMRRERPSTLSTSGKKKRKIQVNPDILNTTTDDQDDKSLSSLSNKSDDDVMTPGGDLATLGDLVLDDMATPDDIDTPEELEDSMMTPDPIPEVSAEEERDDERRWRTCVIGGVQRKIDMKVIEPYKKVLSHGGYYGLKRSAIIVFSACYLPDHSRKDYDYVMDNLFLYVLTTLDQLVAEDYVLVYLHGAMDRNNMPTFGWLKRCYQMIDRRLRKNLKGLYLVHPTFWLKTIVLMTRPFISTKFSRKLQFVNSLQDLADLVPIDQMSIPDRVKQLDFENMIKEKKKHSKVQKPNNSMTELSQGIPSPHSQVEHRQIDHEAAYRVANSEYPAFTKGWV